MRKSLFIEAQVIGILKRAEAGQPVTELCRELGITQQTFYRWRRKYGGMEVSDAQELNRRLDENRRLQHLVAELALDNRILKDVLGKNDAARCAAPERAASADAAAGQLASSLPCFGLFAGERALSGAGQANASGDRRSRNRTENFLETEQDQPHKFRRSMISADKQQSGLLAVGGVKDLDVGVHLGIYAKTSLKPLIHFSAVGHGNLNGITSS